MKSQRLHHLVFKVKCIKLFWQYHSTKNTFFKQAVFAVFKQAVFTVFKQAVVIQAAPNIVIAPLKRNQGEIFSINIIKS